MSNQFENTWSRILVGQLSILLYSVAAAVIGLNATTFILIFILIIVLTMLQNRSSKNPLGQEKVKPEEVLKGRTLYEENNAREYQTKDTEILRDMQDQSRFTLYTSIGMLLAMVYFLLLWGYVSNLYQIVSTRLGEGKLSLFLAFLVYFEGLFAINQVTYFWALKKVGKVTVLQSPPSFTVTDKGILLKGLVSRTAVTFPLPDDVEVNLNEKRRFVELVKAQKRSIVRLRLYTKNPKKLAETIRRYGVKQRAETPQPQGPAPSQPEST